MGLRNAQPLNAELSYRLYGEKGNKMSIKSYIMYLLQVAKAHASKGETELVRMNMYEAHGAVEFLFFNGTPEADSIKAVSYTHLRAHET